MTSTMIPTTIYWPQLPLVVYREIAAHLQQVPGVTAEVLPQEATHFDYQLSQAGGLRIVLPEIADAALEQRVANILNYYRQRFGDWQVL